MMFSVNQAWLCPAGLLMCVKHHSHGFVPYVVLYGLLFFFFLSVLHIISIHAYIFKVQLYNQRSRPHLL